MDHLITSMNSNFPSSLPLFHFPFFEIDYSQENFYVKMDESGSVLGGLQWGFIGFIYNWLLLSWINDHLFSPFIISYFFSIQTPHIFQNTVSPTCSLINVRTICMDLIALDLYTQSQIYFVFLRICRAWLFKRLFANC